MANKKLKFMLTSTGHMSHLYRGEESTFDEFYEKFEAGAYEFEDWSELQDEEVYLEEFQCPRCNHQDLSVPIGGPMGSLCQIACPKCDCCFLVVEKIKCRDCEGREHGCLAVDSLIGE